MAIKNKHIIPFQLVGITTEEFATFKSNFQLGIEKFEIGFGCEFKANPSKKAIGVFTRFDFFQKKENILILESACHFTLEDEYWSSQLENDKIKIPKDLLTHFLVISVGTARGIIHAKKPSWLEGLILPTFNVSSFVKEDMIINTVDEEE